MVTLKDILVKFLKTEQKIKYPVIEASILQINPLQVTDDNLFYLDISSRFLTDPRSPGRSLAAFERRYRRKLPFSAN